jgi:hypothetical protein
MTPMSPVMAVMAMMSVPPMGVAVAVTTSAVPVPASVAAASGECRIWSRKQGQSEQSNHQVDPTHGYLRC